MPKEEKTVLITGANKGIGFEVARQLGKQGWTILAGARNPVLGQQAAARLKEEGVQARFVHLDLNEPATAAATAEQITREFGKLDLLINNAAIAHAEDGPPSTSGATALDDTMRTNFTGTVIVTQAMLPLLRKAGSAQIINVSSELGSISLHTDPEWKYAPIQVLAYCASKAALNMFTVKLAYELRGEDIAVNSVNPGYTATDLNHNSGPQTIEEGSAEIVRVALLHPPVNNKFLETGGELAW